MKKASILVVDDQQQVCDAIQRILAADGHAVVSATSVRDAYRYLEEGRQFDLVITDLMMPKVDGIDLLLIFKEKAPQTAVLIITGYPSPESMVDASRFGAAGYLPKPFTAEELEAAVGELIKDAA